jgi:L-alanine-DL-glutamate epimerase-like enolase superfamily enzyme
VRITDVTVETYRWPCPPIRNGKHVYTSAGLGLAKVHTDDGLTGVGLGDGGELGQAVIAMLKPHLVGADPFDVERLWHAMWQPKLVGRRGLTTRVISAVDIALWDLKGRALGLPLYKLLGGYRREVPVYIAGGYYQEGKGLGELAREMEENVAMVEQHG